MHHSSAIVVHLLCMSLSMVFYYNINSRSRTPFAKSPSQSAANECIAQHVP